MIADICQGLTFPDLVASRLVLLAKKDSSQATVGARPICISESISKLAMSLAVESISDELQSSMTRQFCFSNGGAEKVVHELDDVLQSNPDYDVVTLDCKNAYNSVSRSAMADALYKRPSLANVWQIFFATYGSPYNLIIQDQNKTEFRSCTRGGKQGCPGMSAFFCLALDDTIQAAHREGIWIAAFADDITLCGRSSDIERIIPIIQGKLSEIGLSLNNKKCTVYGSQDLANTFNFSHSTTGVRVLGGFITKNQDDAVQYFDNLCSTHSTFFQEIELLPKDIALHVLTFCGAPKWHFISRVAKPTHDMLLVHQRFDSMVANCLMKILQVEWLSEEQMALISLPRCDGGFGLPSYCITSPCAQPHWSSLCLHRVQLPSANRS